MMKEMLSNKKMLKEDNIDKGGNTLNGMYLKEKNNAQRDTRKEEMF